MSKQSEDLFCAIAGVIGAGVLAFLGKKSSDKNGTSFMQGVADVAEEGMEKFKDSYQKKQESIKKQNRH